MPPDNYPNRLDMKAWKPQWTCQCLTLIIIGKQHIPSGNQVCVGWHDICLSLVAWQTLCLRRQAVPVVLLLLLLFPNCRCHGRVILWWQPHLWISNPSIVMVNVDSISVWKAGGCHYLTGTTPNCVFPRKEPSRYASCRKRASSLPWQPSPEVKKLPQASSQGHGMALTEQASNIAQ